MAQKVLCDGQPVLEMVAIRSPSTGQWQIPEGPCGMHELLSPAIAAEFGPAALESLPVCWGEGVAFPSFLSLLADSSTVLRLWGCPLLQFPKDDIKVLTQQLQQLFSPHGGQDVGRGLLKSVHG